MFKRKKRHRLPRRSAREVWRKAYDSVTGWIGWVLILPLVGLYWLYDRVKGQEPPEPEPEPERDPLYEDLIPSRVRATTVFTPSRRSTPAPPLTPERIEEVKEYWRRYVEEEERERPAMAAANRRLAEEEREWEGLTEKERKARRWSWQGEPEEPAEPIPLRKRIGTFLLGACGEVLMVLTLPITLPFFVYHAVTGKGPEWLVGEESP